MRLTTLNSYVAGYIKAIKDLEDRKILNLNFQDSGLTREQLDDMIRLAAEANYQTWKENFNAS